MYYNACTLIIREHHSLQEARICNAPVRRKVVLALDGEVAQEKEEFAYISENKDVNSKMYTVLRTSLRKEQHKTHEEQVRSA